MLIHLNFWVGLVTAALLLIALVGGGIAAYGLIRKGALEAAKTALETYEKSVAQLKEALKEAQDDIATLKTTVGKMERESKFKAMQLGMALRVIEHFEHLVTIYARHRRRIPEDVCAQMDARLIELAAFRERAALELESEEINQDFYEWLTNRATLSGPSLFGAKMPADTTGKDTFATRETTTQGEGESK